MSSATEACAESARMLGHVCGDTEKSQLTSRRKCYRNSLILKSSLDISSKRHIRRSSHWNRRANGQRSGSRATGLVNGPTLIEDTR